MDFKSTIIIFGAALIFIPPLIISSPISGAGRQVAGNVCYRSDNCENGLVCKRDPFEDFGLCVKDLCKAKDSDACLKASGNSWGTYTCSSSTKWCTSWAKDMKRCCPYACGVTGSFSESDCNDVAGKGSCIYPNEAQPDETQCNEGSTTDTSTTETTSDNDAGYTHHADTKCSGDDLWTFEDTLDAAISACDNDGECGCIYKYKVYYYLTKGTETSGTNYYLDVWVKP